MTIKDLIQLYESKKQKYGNETYKYISELFSEAKELHKSYVKLKGITDTEQSWRAFKGKNLEKLIIYIITNEVRELGLEIVNGSILERTQKLSQDLDMLKRKLCIDYGEFGLHLPDVDIVIYNPKTFKIIAVLSSKVTLRERIAQTGYWKLKLLESKVTKHIKVFFITLDEDGTLLTKKPARKGRAITETDTDGCYILTNKIIEASNRVKSFSDFIKDLKSIL